MALRFHSEFRNIRRELFKVEIYDSSFSGSSTEFTLRGNGFQLAYNGGEETYQLIKSSTLSFVMNIDNSTLKALPSDIASSTDISRFAVKLYRDDTYTLGNNYTPSGSNYVLFWAGCINKRIMSIQDADYPYDFRISAVDGIELLKNYTYNNVSDSYIFEDRLSVVGFLTKIIDKLDFANNFSVTDIVLATRINWFETNHSLNDSVAAKTYMYESVFNTVDENENTKLSTYYDVLKHICDLFQCRFMLYEGKFWYTQFSRLKESSNSYFLYKLNGTSASNTVKLINEIKGELGGVYDTGGSVATSAPGFYLREKTFGQRLNSAKIIWNALADGGQNIYPLTYFPVWQFPNAGWIPYGQNSNGPNLSGYLEDGDEITFKIQMKFSIRVARDQSTASTPLGNNAFYGKVVLPFWFLAKDNNNVFTANRWWRATGNGSPTGVVLSVPEDEGSTYNGSWLYDSNSYNTATKFKTGSIYIPSSASIGTEEVFDFDVTISTGIVNVPEVLGMFFYNDYSGGWDSALGDGDWFAVEDSSGNLSSADNWVGYTVDPIFDSISIAPYQDGEPFLGTTVDSYVTEGSSDSNNPEELTINTIKWGDGPSSLGLRTLWTLSGSNLVQSNLWQINNTGTTYKIHKLITDEILKYNYFSGERLNATIYQSPNLYASQRLNISEGFDRDYVDEDGTTIEEELYCFSSLSYNPNLASWNFKGKKISLPAPTITTTTPTETNQITLGGKAMSSIGSSLNSLQDEESTAKLNQNLSPSDTGTTSLTITATDIDLDNNTILLIQSSNSERNWEKIQLSAAASKGATSISIDSFNPTYTYDQTSRILLSRETLIGGTQGPQGPPGQNGAVSSLTTTGTSGASTLTNGVLNIPNYQGGGGSDEIYKYSNYSQPTSISDFTIGGVDYKFIQTGYSTIQYLFGYTSSGIFRSTMSRTTILTFNISTFTLQNSGGANISTSTKRLIGASTQVWQSNCQGFNSNFNNVSGNTLSSGSITTDNKSSTQTFPGTISVTTSDINGGAGLIDFRGGEDQDDCDIYYPNDTTWISGYKTLKFNLSCNDGSSTQNESQEYKFYNNYYYGVYVDATLTSTYSSGSGAGSIFGLGNAVFAQSSVAFTTTFSTVNDGTGQYFHLAYPTRYGTKSTWTIAANPNDTVLVGTITVINQYGYSEPYYHYRTENRSIGASNIEIIVS